MAIINKPPQADAAPAGAVTDTYTKISIAIGSVTFLVFTGIIVFLLKELQIYAGKLL